MIVLHGECCWYSAYNLYAKIYEIKTDKTRYRTLFDDKISTDILVDGEMININIMILEYVMIGILLDLIDHPFFSVYLE